MPWKRAIPPSTPAAVPAMVAPPPTRRNPLTGSVVGLLGLGFLGLMVLVCLGTLPYTLGRERVRVEGADGTVAVQAGAPRYASGNPAAGRLPPLWFPKDEVATAQAASAVPAAEAERIAAELAEELGVPVEEVAAAEPDDPLTVAYRERLAAAAPKFLLGSDVLGRSLWVRVLAGGGISLGIGIAAAAISVVIGTLYGALAGYAGGKTDAVMMRVVDVLYGLPYILLVVLLAVAGDAVLERLVARYGEISTGARTTIDVLMLLVAIGGVSWLTMARVVRGQVLSLKGQPFVEAARAAGASPRRVFCRHLLPNLVGPIVVYATLTVPQAILQESFLSFLGIGVQPPLPSWGNLAAEGLVELNGHRSHWWLLLFPSVLLGLTLLSLNFVGEGLREAFDPRRRK